MPNMLISYDCLAIKRQMVYKTQVTRASSKSTSLRTTIPEKVVQETKLKPGDVLDWEVSSSEKGRLIMKIKKLE